MFFTVSLTFYVHLLVLVAFEALLQLPWLPCCLYRIIRCRTGQSSWQSEWLISSAAAGAASHSALLNEHISCSSYVQSLVSSLSCDRLQLFIVYGLALFLQQCGELPNLSHACRLTQLLTHSLSLSHTPSDPSTIPPFLSPSVSLSHTHTCPLFLSSFHFSSDMLHCFLLQFPVKHEVLLCHCFHILTYWYVYEEVWTCRVSLCR